MQILAWRRGRERWRAVDRLRYIAMLALWTTIFILRIFLDFLPTLAVDLSSPAPARGFAPRCRFGDFAIGRALSQALTLINDVPISTRKYDFVVNTAERIIDDNAITGRATLQRINREALSGAFSRTAERLRLSLRVSHEPWPLRALRLLPLGPLVIACISALAEFCLPTADQRIQSPEAEKLSQELLWVANKMKSCGVLDDVVLRWSNARELSALSLMAHPRAQGPLVKISAMILKEMAKKGGRVPREVRFRVMALWVPLLCHAGVGAGCPVLTGFEKRDVERVLEGLVQEMPWEDQELVLASWMQNFAFSASDWPDLRGCYDLWCQSSRKLLSE